MPLLLLVVLGLAPPAGEPVARPEALPSPPLLGLPLLLPPPDTDALGVPAEEAESVVLRLALPLGDWLGLLEAERLGQGEGEPLPRALPVPPAQGELLPPPEAEAQLVELGVLPLLPEPPAEPLAEGAGLLLLCEL